MTTDDLLSRKMFTRNLHIPRQEVIPNNGLAPDDDTTYRNNPKSQTITSCEHDVALLTILVLAHPLNSTPQGAPFDQWLRGARKGAGRPPCRFSRRLGVAEAPGSRVAAEQIPNPCTFYQTAAIAKRRDEGAPLRPERRPRTMRAATPQKPRQLCTIGNPATPAR